MCSNGGDTVVDVPPERRRYIKPEDVPKYQQRGVSVYRGRKGGYYIDRLESRQKRIKESKEKLGRMKYPFEDKKIEEKINKLLEEKAKDIGAGRCLISALNLTRLLREKGYNAKVYSGEVDNVPHSFTVVDISGEKYIYDLEAPRQFGLPKIRKLSEAKEYKDISLMKEDDYKYWINKWKDLMIRKGMIKKELSNEFENITTVVDDYDLQLLELGFQKIQRRFARWARKYPKSMVYQALIEGEMWKNYKGLSKKDCEKINDILVKSILEGKYTKPELVAKRIEKEVRLPYNRALLIAKTELANMANKARELAYKSMTKVQKFVWITERDSKVCEKCKEVARRSQNGVSLEELKRIIKEVAPDTARELLVHPGCRCSVYRYYPDKRYVRWWEKADVPPERRIYINDWLIEQKLKKRGVPIYVGARGGKYIDKNDLERLNIDKEEIFGRKFGSSRKWGEVSEKEVVLYEDLEPVIKEINEELKDKLELQIIGGIASKGWSSHDIDILVKPKQYKVFSIKFVRQVFDMIEGEEEVFYVPVLTWDYSKFDFLYHYILQKLGVRRDFRVDFIIELPEDIQRKIKELLREEPRIYLVSKNELEQGLLDEAPHLAPKIEKEIRYVILAYKIGRMAVGWLKDLKKILESNIKKAEIPPERRLYIKPEDAPKYQQVGVTVHRGKKGGLYIDKLEAQQKGVDIETEEERRRKAVDRRVQKLSNEIKRLGLEEKLESELKNVFEGNEDDAYESYFKIRGVFRKLKKGGVINEKDYSRLVIGLRNVYRRRFGYLPGIKAMKDVISQEKEEIEQKPKEIDIDNLISKVKDMDYVKWVLESRKLKDLAINISGSNVDVLKKIIDNVDGSFGLKGYFDRREAEFALANLYILKKFAESLKDKNAKKEFEEKLSNLLSMVDLDLSQLDYMADKVMIMEKGRILDIINEINADDIIVKYDNETVDYLSKLVKYIGSVLKEYGLTINGKVYYPYKSLRQLILNKVDLSDVEFQVSDDLVYGCLNILDDNKFEEYMNEYQSVLKKLDEVFGLKIMDDARVAFSNVRKVRPYLKSFRENNAKDIDIDKFRIADRQFANLSNIITGYARHIDVQGKDIMSFQRYVEDYYEDEMSRYIKRHLSKTFSVVFGLAKFFERIGFDRKTAMALAKGWEVMRSWTLSDFKKYTGHIEEYVHRIRGNSRPKRAKQKIDNIPYKKLFEFTAPEEVNLYRKFTEDFVRRYYGNEVKVFRGVSDFEFVQIVRAMFKQKTKSVKLKATLVSTSLSPDVAEEFATGRVIVRTKINPEQVWGGWWNASPDYEREQEFIVEFPEEGMDVELVSIDSDFEKVFRLYTEVFEKGELIENASEWEKFVYPVGGSFRLVGLKVLESLQMIKNKEIFKPMVKDIIDVWSNIYDKMVESLRNLEGVSENDRNWFFTRFEAILIDLNKEFSDVEGVKEFYEKVKKDRKEILGG